MVLMMMRMMMMMMSSSLFPVTLTRGKKIPRRVPMVWLIATVAFFFTIGRARGDDSSCWEYKDDCDYQISGWRGLTGFRSSYKGGMSRTGLVTLGKHPSVTMGLCEGDCDHDNQCEDGLECYQRNNYVTVPGCGDGGKHDYDYCYDPHGDRVVEFSDSEDLGGLADNGEEQEGMTRLHNSWEFTWNDQNPPRYFTGWRSYWHGNDNDRKYRVRSRAVADGWTVEDCAWSDTNNFFDSDTKNIQASTNKYAFGVKSEVSKEELGILYVDRKFSFYFCRPVPPPPPPPSPPPPSPPPGADITDLVVIIDNPARLVADKEFNFNIKVSDSACEGADNNCFGTPNDVDANTGKGLKCEAFVKKSEDATCDYSNAGTHAPCMKWDNFYDENKRGETRFSFNSEDADGVKQIGEYEIKYNCYWHLTDGTKVPGSWNRNDAYIHTENACVGGHNIQKLNNKTLDECKAICSEMSDCLGFEYGVEPPDPAWSGSYEPGDCNPQSSSTLDLFGQDCATLDFYEKTAPPFETLHTFNVTGGCPDVLQSETSSGNAETTMHVVARFLLLSSPIFLKMQDCDQIDVAKEEVFRKYDINPMDGKLSAAELKYAFESHDMQTTYIDHLESITDVKLFENGGLLLRDIMDVMDLPNYCYFRDGNVHESDLRIASATYSSSDDLEEDCKSNAEHVNVSWTFEKNLMNGDFQCIFTDGFLFKTITDSSVRKVTDYRPAVGTGADAVTLRKQMFSDELNEAEDTYNTHFEHECVDGHNIQKLNNKTLDECKAICSEMSICLGIEYGVEALEDRSGGFDPGDCNPQSLGAPDNFDCATLDFYPKETHAIDLELNFSFSSSAIMTWINLGDQDEITAGDLWRGKGGPTEDDDQLDKYFRIKSDRTLEAGFFDRDENEINTNTIDTVPSSNWHHVAMVLNKKYGFSIFLNGKQVVNTNVPDPTNIDSHFVQEHKHAYTICGTDSSLNFDDYRIYTGELSTKHVQSIYRCNCVGDDCDNEPSDACAKLAIAKPQSRRVYCILPEFQDDTFDDFIPCIAGLYYNGAVIDVNALNSQKGVIFSFRDTAWGESNFEVLRALKRPGATEFDDADAVVLIDTDIQGCARTFSSITFFDDEAIKEPGYEWEYTITTKYGTEEVILSDPITYVTPWFSLLEGVVLVGKTELPVKNVRVCADIFSQDHSSAMLENIANASGEDDINLARYVQVSHSNEADVTKRSSAFKVADTDTSTFTTLDVDEWVTVQLSKFSKISTVRVRVDSGSENANLVVRALDYPDPTDSGDKGAICIKSDGLSDSSGFTHVFACEGTSLEAYSGQSITVKSLGTDTVQINEVEVFGTEIVCPFTSFSDNDGNFEIELSDPAGLVPKKARVATFAYKADTFDPSDEKLFELNSAKSPTAYLMSIHVNAEEHDTVYDNTQELELLNGWIAYDDDDFGPPRHLLYNNVCFVQGAIKDGSWNDQPLVRLPVACRPKQRLAFNLNINGTDIARVDVQTDGYVYRMDDGHEDPWISLTGITFPVNTVASTEDLTLGSGVINHGGKYGNAYYSAHDDFCFLQGFVKIASPDEVDMGNVNILIATLPSACTPKYPGIYLAGNSKNAQVYVLNDGRILLRNGVRLGATEKTSYFTLSGIGFQIRTNKPRKFLSDLGLWVNGWEDFHSGGWQKPSYFVSHDSDNNVGICTLVGLVKNENAQNLNLPMVQLPEECRPKMNERLSFNLYGGGNKYLRVDVKSNGEIQLMSSSYHAWISLAGITFVTSSTLADINNDTVTSSTLADINNDTVIDKSEFVTFIKGRSRYSDVQIIIPSRTWDALDKDNSGDLNSREFLSAESSFNEGHIYGTRWLLYGAEETKHLTQFHLTNYPDNSNVAVSLVPVDNATTPRIQEDWQMWYNTMSETSGLSFERIPTVADDTSLASIVDGSLLPETKRFFLTIVTLLNDHYELKDEQVSSTDEADVFANDVLPDIAFEVHATFRLPDVLHVFNTKEPNVRVFPIKHLGVAGVEFEDETSVPVTGMVRFPGERTQDYICGLQFATISAYKGRKCGSDESSVCSPKGYLYESDPDVYTADELGHFEIAITPGETRAFVASYTGHEICYGGDALDVDACKMQTSSEVTLNDDAINQNVYVEIENIVGGEFMLFFDVTEREVDIGLFAGACGTRYSDYSLKITPANGCGSTVIVQGTDITSSTDRWGIVDDAGTYRRWPYAAMDYYIELDQVPDASWLDENQIKNDDAFNHADAASCTAPGSGFKKFFEDRNMLVQTLLLLENVQADAKYDYHGWFCALPTFGSSDSESTISPFTAIDADEVCLGDNVGSLTSEHLIGNTDSQYSQLGADDVSRMKYVALKVFEAHQTAPQKIEYCYTFESTINGVATDLGISVRIQEDVGPQSSNECHSSNEPSSDCLFTNVNGETGYLQFSDSTESFTIDSNGALPNLVSPHRRKFLARLERNDGWSVTNLEIHRELVPLASKIRGESSDLNARYVPDTKFYATAPIRGLVYTVVHDPPGGNSYARILQGTRIELNLGLTTVRSASRSSEFGFDLGVDTGFETKPPGGSIGSAYANVNVEFDAEGNKGGKLMGISFSASGGRLADGPEVTASAETDNSWDFQMTLDRNIESSTDPGIPGRPGDVVLGGGFEIIYVRTDVVDIRDNCLTVVEQVEWFPRKPTSYCIEIFTIEERIIPELEELVELTHDANSIMTDNELDGTDIKAVWRSRLSQSIEDWRNTIDWTSPDFNPEGLNALEDKQTTLAEIQSSFDDKSVPFNSNESVFGRIARPKIEDVSNVYESASSDSESSEAEKNWDDLSDVWNSIPDENSPIHNVPKIRRDDAYAHLNGWDANAAAAGVGAGVGQILGPLGSIAGAIAGALVDRLANPNPQGYLRDIALDDIVKGKDAKGDNKGDWTPDGELWLDAYAEDPNNPSEKNVFNSKENDADVDDGLWSRGASDVAKNHWPFDGIDNTFFGNSKLIDGSVFGSAANFGFSDSGTDDTTDDPTDDPAPDPSLNGDAPVDIYLTFSGGGHSLDFSSSVSSLIDSYGYSWTFSGDALVRTNHDTSASAGWLTSEFEYHDIYGKDASIERAMAWGKHGDLEVEYSLGDDDPFDKFIIHVSSDKRFGTPLFKTIGGASKCPGEPNTMWRESEVDLESAWAAGVNNEYIPPHSNALYDLTITNASPYRETMYFGLLLTSGEAHTADFGGNMLDLTFTINQDRLRPFGSLLTLSDVPSVDASGNLKHSRLTLEIERGKLAHEYTSIGVQLVSECEWQLSRDWMYREALSSTTFLGDFKWEKECPKVTWNDATYNTYLNYVASKEKSPYMNLTVTNPDPLNLWSSDWVDGNSKKTNHLVHKNVQFVRLQWRNLGEGEWINAWDMNGNDADIWKNDIVDGDVQCAASRGAGCEMKWNLERQYFFNGLKDGSYEIRAKVFCSGYDSFATSEVRSSITDENLNLVVDIDPPEATETTVLNRVVTIQYSEEITCPQLQSDHMAYAIKQIKTCGDNDVNTYISADTVYSYYKFKCLKSDNRGSLMVTFPQGSGKSGLFEITVNADSYGSKITDAGGNPAERQTFEAMIGCATSHHFSSAKLGAEPRGNENYNPQRYFANISAFSESTRRVLYITLGAAIALFSSNFIAYVKRKLGDNKRKDDIVVDRGECNSLKEGAQERYGAVL